MAFTQERNWTGIDTYDAPQRLAPGMAVQMDNALVQGGDIVTRPGIQGQFAAALPGPIWELTPFQKPDGTTTLVFASGGKLYQWPAGSSSAPTEIVDAGNGGASFAFPDGGEGVRMVRHGRFLYGVPGAGGGALFRTDLTGGGSMSYAGLTAPTAAPAVALANTAVAVPGAWNAMAAPSSGANLTADPSFEGTVPGTTWQTAAGPDPDTTGAIGDVTPFDGLKCLALDDPGEGVFQRIPGVSLPTVALPGSLTGGKARQYLFRLWMHSADHFQNTASFDVSLSAQDAGNTTIGGASGNFKPNYQSDATAFQPFSLPLNLLSLPSDPDHLVVTLQGGQNNVRGHRVFGDVAQLLPYTNQLLAQPPGADGLRPVNVVPDVADPYAYAAAHPLTAAELALAAEQTAGQFLYTDLGTATDFTPSSVVNLRLSMAAGVARADGSAPTFRFGFARAADTEVSWSNIAAFDAAGENLSADCSAVDAAVRGAARYFFLQILDNVAAVTAGQTLFRIGALTFAGKLSVGFADVQYLFEEVATPAYAAGAGDVILSSGSPVSAAVTPTAQQAQTDVVVPAPANAAADHLNVYRIGGVYSDGFFRLLATVPLSSDAAGDGWTWNHSARTFHDNIPDADLLEAATYEKYRDNFPAGCSALCVANGRLMAAKGNTVYVSWLLADGRESGLYTSFKTDPEDPSVAVKGFTATLDSANVYDGIVALLPLTTAVVVLRQSSITLLNGYDPSNYAAVDQYASAGVGCVAPRSAVVEHNVVSFLSASGVVSYNIAQVVPASVPLEGALRGLTPAAFARCAAVYHDRRRFLFAPVAGGGQNSVAYVYDTRTNGYTRWTGTPATSAASLSSDADAQDLYLGGFDGQVYRVGRLGDADTTDRATPAGAAQPIPFALLTRAMGQEEAGSTYFYENRLQKFWCSVETPAAGVTLNLSAVGSTNPGAVWRHAYRTKAAGGDTTFDVRIRGHLSGANFQLGLSASVTKPLRVHSLAAYHEEGRRLP